MELVVSSGKDFDALAAMVACTKLHPGSRVALLGDFSPAVNRFLLKNREVVPCQDLAQLSSQAISRLFIIKPPGSRLDEELTNLYPESDQVVTYSLSEDELFSGRQRSGTLTASLTNLLVERGLEICPSEATLFLLGIYQGSRCLTSEETTTMDFAIASWLLGRGANMAAVGDYLGVPFTVEQHALVDVLLEDARLQSVNQRTILIVTANLGQYISGLAELTWRLTAIEDWDMVVSIIQLGRKVRLIAVTNRVELDMRKILSPLGAEGNAKMVAVTTEFSPSQLYTRLNEVLAQRLPRGVGAGDIMSTPVYTFAGNTSVAEAHRSFLRHGYSLAPILGPNQEVRGMVTSREVSKALVQNNGHLPLEKYINYRTVPVNIHTSVAEVARVVVHNDLEGVPVLDRDQLVGVITRRDLLAQIYGAEDPLSPRYSYRDYNLAKAGTNLAELIKNRLPQRLQGILMVLGQLGHRAGLSLYAVGGFVRDLLLGLPIWDLDVAVEGDAIALTKELAAVIGGKAAFYPEMGTATLVLTEGLRIDIATTRTEVYQLPAARPTVAESTIKQDLHRRDFTINAMALSLNPPRFGDYYDFFNGYGDLGKGLVRVLYNLSFVDDPTRILRAIRFAGRYGFSLEEETKELLRTAVADDMLARVTPGKLGKELGLWFNEINAPVLLRLAWDLGVLAKLVPGSNWNSSLERQLTTASRLCQWQNRRGSSGYSHLLYPLLLILSKGQAQCGEECLGLSKEEGQLVNNVIASLPSLYRSLQEVRTATGVYDLLRPQPPLAILALLAAFPEDAALKVKVLLYTDKLVQVRVSIDGADLAALGVIPGPAMGRILNAVHRARLAGEVNTFAEELALAQNLVMEGEGDCPQ